MLEVTNFGDQAVLMPVAAAVGIVLALSGWRRGALAWAAGVAGVYGLVFGLKLALLPCSAGAVYPFDLRSPSGHTAGAGIVYGALSGLGIAWAIGPSRWTRARGMLGTLAAVLPVVGLMGWSRVSLGLHSVADVVAGAVIGSVGAVVVVLAAGPPLRRRWGWAIGMAGLAALALAYGQRFPGEALIRSIAAVLWADPACRA